ncbi:bacillithiol biosynthesis cysteine-adding enzyme BshC [Cecembia calidifontis]|uniref:Putative cysteine ligase BshC n=1 Tax=Cecembia calidifontis TaxID=1187080 RepID=A0A4Q7P4M7_9BACT|nr:bacillithiol biosynthesis cysteine-adding enzyme BshC [Cecembia calidifontis]RZS94953.1 bacillithiol biosynthesis cysteine-adding enzyme BshC [Cecembia calidifontis]
MIKSSVDPECTGQFSQLFLDYIKLKPQLSPFFNVFPRIQYFESLINGKNFPSHNREVLHKALEKQYEGLEVSELTSNQINSVKHSGTFTVTTGHQLNLFTGPLYFIYKIVSTINLAEQLKSTYPDYHFVPVYWMASEDHDFDEINYFKLDGKKYQWQTDQKGPVGNFKLDQSFKTFFEGVNHFVPDFFREAYLSSNHLSQAVRKYVHHLFGEKGLLIIDGNDADLKSLFSQVIREDLISHLPHELVQKQTEELELLGYKSQIFPREINLFYMEEGLRERIELDAHGRYKILNTDIIYSKEEIEKLIDQFPEKFSPNVVLRPLYQEMILPNLAYLGGPAEVVYWLQLKPVFDHFGIQFPALLPRNFAMILDIAIQRKISKLGLEDIELFQSVEEWKKQFLEEHAAFDLTLAQEKESLKKIFDQAGHKAVGLDQTLEGAFQAAKVRALKILEQLSGKVRKAEERKQAVHIRQRMEIQEYLNPGGSPQERVENFMRFYLGNENFIQELFELFDPLDFNYLILKMNHG